MGGKPSLPHCASDDAFALKLAASTAVTKSRDLEPKQTSALTITRLRCALIKVGGPRIGMGAAANLGFSCPKRSLACLNIWWALELEKSISRSTIVEGEVC
jgi:hypothetical protein